MKIRNLFSLALLLAGLQSCIETVELDWQQTESVLVLNGLATPHRDTVVVWMSESRPVASNADFVAIENARIELFDGGVSVGLLSHAVNGKYILPFRVEQGHTYRVEATVGTQTLWAETTVPPAVEAQFSRLFYGGFSGCHRVLLTDAPDVGNAYWITAIDSMHAQGPWGTASLVLYCNHEFADDFNQKVIHEGDFKFDYEYYIRFSDREFNGSETEIIFKPNGDPSYSLVISADSHLDRYMKSSLKLLEMDRYSEDMPMIYVPFPVYSNINGGTGIWGSYSLATHYFEPN